jgi:hypothetical protein
MVEWQLPKLHAGVRFPSPAIYLIINHLTIEFGRKYAKSEQESEQIHRFQLCLAMCAEVGFSIADHSPKPKFSREASFF